MRKIRTIVIKLKMVVQLLPKLTKHAGEGCSSGNTNLQDFAEKLRSHFAPAML